MYNDFMDDDDKADTLMSYYMTDKGYEYKDNFKAYPVLSRAIIGQKAQYQRFEGMSISTHKEIENKHVVERGKPINRD